MPDKSKRQVTAFGPAGHFYECPRWRDGRWWVSDMRGGAVYSFSANGDARIELRLDDRPAGLGWALNGALLVVSMEAKQLLTIGGNGSIASSLDLAPLFGTIKGFLNDLAVSRSGHAYVGMDADFHAYGPDAELGMIAHVSPQGFATIAARDLAFPNGIVFTPDESTLVVAETMKPRLTSFAIEADGALGAARRWGVVGQQTPFRSAGADRPASLDGCAMDAAGYIWAADVNAGCLRIAPGGEVVDAVILPNGLRSFACGLGGVDGRTLIICGADDNFQDRTSRREAQLFTTQVEIGAA